MTGKKVDITSGCQWQLIREEAAKLAETLSQSTEYRRFLAARDRLSESDNASALAELRQRQMALRLCSSFIEDTEDDLSEYDSQYMLLAQDPLISDYLFAEGRFFRLIADVEKVFSERLDLWQDEDSTSSHLETDINLN